MAAATSTNGRAASKAVTSVIENRLQSGSEAGIEANDAVLELAIVHLMPALAGSVSCELWWALLDMVASAAAQRNVRSLGEDISGNAAWTDQLLGGELPLTLAYLFPELQRCQDLASGASSTLGDAIVTLTDGEGLLHARHLPWLRPIWACWTRCQGMAQAAGITAFDEDAEVQLEWLVRQAMRLARSDGSQLLGSGDTCQWQPELFRAAIDLAGDDEDIAAAEIGLPADVEIGEASDSPCEAAVESEWSELAILRTDWDRAAPRLAVDFSKSDIELELEVGRETIISGPWQLAVLKDGSAVDRKTEWHEVCWYSDDDVDYLEISADLGGGGCVERQILLAREDQFLLLWDNVLVPSSESIECQSTLPLADAVDVSFEEETREAMVGAKKPRALVLPIALAEWRIDSRFGTLDMAEGMGRALQLNQRGGAGGLACPLFIDLRPRRFKKKRTWRQLTVAESLEVCPRETAVAYRVQCGQAQWVFYRSLAPTANRTFFGQNVSSEFFAGRFHRDGEVEELLEIEEE